MGEVGVQGGGAVQAGGFFDLVGVGAGLDEPEQGLVFVHGFVGAAGDKAERGGPQRRQPVPAPVDQVQDVRVGAVLEQDAVEVLVQPGEPDGVEVVQAFAHLRVDRPGPGHVRRPDQRSG